LRLSALLVSTLTTVLTTARLFSVVR